MPSHDFSKKLTGLLVPVFALREEGDMGIGDTKSLRCAIDFCAAHHFGVLQILPINETGGDNSPYNAISSVALDPVLLHMSPTEVPCLGKKDLKELAPAKARDELNRGPVNYYKVKQLKLDLLHRAYANFRDGGAEQRADFETFQKLHVRWLPGYSLFRALLDEHHGDPRWPLWAPEWRTLDSAERNLTFSPHGVDIRDRQKFYTFVQWVAYRQWNDVKKYATSRRVMLMGDIPFGISRYGADVWGERSLFSLEWSGGAPPEKHFKSDPFTVKWGQNWGIPLYDWPANERQGFAWWKQRVAMTCNVFHAFRIDHVLGFFRVYSFPWTPERNAEFANLSEEEVKKITHGRIPQFVPHPDEPEEFAELNAQAGEKLLRMILNAAGDSIVVAEDLGMVPTYVRPLLQEMGIPGFTIPTFERDEKDKSYTSSVEYPQINLVTYATHDHPPIAQFYDDLVKYWTGPNGHEGWLEICRLMEFLGLPSEEAPQSFTPELHQEFIAALLETDCWLAVLMITDLFGTHQRFNAPGSTGASNWSERLEASLESLAQTTNNRQILEAAAELIAENDRSP